MNREIGRKNMMGFCKLCPVCNGKACAGEIPGMGGAETGQSFSNNVEALRNIQVNMKVLYDGNQSPDTSSSLLGMDLALPLLVAPIGGVSFNVSPVIDEIIYCNHLAQACKENGIMNTYGDGAKELVLDAAVETMKKFPSMGIPFIKPWEDQEYLRKVARFDGLGVRCIGMDIDSLGLANVRIRGGEIPLRKNHELEQLIKKIPYPVIIKGVMDAQEAQRLVDMGAAAIVVSNHGGRILDCSPGTAEVLPSIVAKINAQVPVLVDGGIHSGLDIYKMLALGADAVLIGRGFAHAVMCDPQEGASQYIQQLKAQLIKAMLLTGCHCITDIRKHASINIVK